jgi:carbon monoxide dehydrogenase subunit G
MEFTHEFHVPSDVDTTFATLIDLEKVAPCLPGATLEEVDGDTYTGRVKVKVGPIQVIYRGTAEIVEADHEAHRGRIEARGKETRGAGTASADVVATLHGDGEGTRVVVETDLHITGKPAQFGRGVMADVGTKIIDSFAERLRAMLEAGEDGGEGAVGAGEVAVGAAPAGPGPEAVATGAAAAGRPGARRIEPTPGREDDALDLLEVAGAATAKRVLPLVAVLVAIAALLWWLRRR